MLGDIVDAEGAGVAGCERVHRGQEGIKRLAPAIREGDARRGDRGAAAPGTTDVTWIDVDRRRSRVAARRSPPVRERRGRVGERGHRRRPRGRRRAARWRRSATFRLLCAHRRGLHGVSVWTARIEAWLEGRVGRARWYPGRPLLVTKNDYGLDLYNGDAGVVVAHGRRAGRGGVRAPAAPGRAVAAERGRDDVRDDRAQVARARSSARPRCCCRRRSSQILTRELLYTAVTRARPAR